MRAVLPEILDGLAPGDPRAQGSRRDLRRVNAIMGNARVVAGLLAPFRPRRILEIGAGDGTFMMRVVGRLREGSPRREVRAQGGTGGEGAAVFAVTERMKQITPTLPSPLSTYPLTPNSSPPEGRGEPCLTLLDRQPCPAPEGFAALGWRCETVAADAFDYLRGGEPFDAVVANLFLHHFEDDRLRELLRLVAARTGLFVACEPRRTALALAGCATLGLLGCNDVTRHDARVSVRAGFAGRELSALWPAGWDLTERAAPPFGHAFRAVRR